MGFLFSNKSNYLSVEKAEVHRSPCGHTSCCVFATYPDQTLGNCSDVVTNIFQHVPDSTFNYVYIYIINMSHMSMIVPYDYWFYTPVFFQGFSFFRFFQAAPHCSQPSIVCGPSLDMIGMMG